MIVKISFIVHNTMTQFHLSIHLQIKVQTVFWINFQWHLSWRFPVTLFPPGKLMHPTSFSLGFINTPVIFYIKKTKMAANLEFRSSGSHSQWWSVKPLNHGATSAFTIAPYKMHYDSPAYLTAWCILAPLWEINNSWALGAFCWWVRHLNWQNLKKLFNIKPLDTARLPCLI